MAFQPGTCWKAANAIDKLLEKSPESRGVEFYGDRLLAVGPLHVVYTLDAKNRMVTVVDFWIAGVD